MDLETVIEMLREEYKKALQQKWILKPVAWSLYQTWKKVDKEEKPRDGGI